MCDTADDTDLLAYEEAACFRRLRIVERDGAFVPVNTQGIVQRFGYRRPPRGDTAIRMRWTGKRWIGNA